MSLDAAHLSNIMLMTALAVTAHYVYVVYMSALFVAIVAFFGLCAGPGRLLQRKFLRPSPQQTAVVITGVSGGLGAAVAQDLAKQGFKVFGTVRKQTDADALRSAGVIHPLLLDIGSSDQLPEVLREISKALKKEGRKLCALVNNAGITGAEQTRELTFVGAEHYERVLGTNVFGMVRITEALLPMLKACEGARVINLGSYFGEVAPGNAFMAPYVASKCTLPRNNHNNDNNTYVASKCTHARDWQCFI